MIKKIMDNPAFRIALLNEEMSSNEIAAKFNISAVRVRELRKKHGRPVAYRLPHGWVTSKKWQQYADWVSDVRALRHKEVVAKYGWSEKTVTTMREQLGVGSRRVVKTKEYKNAIKTRLAKEVNAIYGVSLASIAVARRKMKITRAYGKYKRLDGKRFANDIVALPTRAVMEKYNISKANVFYYRKGLKKRNADSQSG